MCSRVLVVDDDLFCAKMVGLFLVRLQLQVEHAASGSECLQRAEREPFDLILMDCQMPGMSGFEVTRELRRRGHHKPILAVTACDRPESVRRCHEAGMDGHLTKPVDMESLREVVLKHVFDPLAQARRLAQAAGNESLLDQLASTFRRCCQSCIDRLATATKEADESAALCVLHRLKGSAVTFGAHYLARMAGHAEDHIRRYGLDETNSHLQELLEFWPTLKSQLEGAAV